jgi:hypothetical protein
MSGGSGVISPEGAGVISTELCSPDAVCADPAALRAATLSKAAITAHRAGIRRLRMASAYTAVAPRPKLALRAKVQW